MSKNLCKLLTKNMLEYEYKLCGSLQKIADKYHISVDSVSKYMKLYDISYNKHYSGIYSCNNSLFTCDTESSFYWAGFIAADGSLQQRKYSKILKITLSNKDKSHLEKFKISINSTHPIKCYKVKPSKLINKEHMCSEIQLVNDLLFDSLGRFNIVPNKTFTYNIPNFLLNHSLSHHFMRGYFDGDGCITNCGLIKNRKIVQGSFEILGTKDFIENYQSILINKANLHATKINKHYGIYKLNYSGNNNIKNIYNFLYNDAHVYLDRKHNKFLNFLKRSC